MTDQEIHASILNGGNRLEKATQHILASHSGMMYQIKKKLHLSDSEIKDLFADAIAHLIWNIKKGFFLADSSISTYLYRIFYNKSVDHLRHITTNKNRPTIDLSPIDVKTSDDLEINSYDKIAADQVKNEIKSMGEPCSGILLDWAYWGYNMKEIAERNSLENSDIAKKKKYSCLKKLRAMLTVKNIS